MLVCFRCWINPCLPERFGFILYIDFIESVVTTDVLRHHS